MGNNEYKNFIEEIKRKTDIVKVVGETVKLNNSNMGICPFHEDGTPSLSIDAVKQLFHCFGCGQSGDVIRFVELTDRVSFNRALKKLAGDAGISCPGFSNESRQEIEEKRQIENILTETGVFYQSRIAPDVMRYLTDDRGLSEETIKTYRIGYADGGLKNHLVDKRNFPEELCIKAGVLKRTENNRVLDYFYKRIIFPTIKGRQIVYLTGRALGDNKPKYLHLKGEIRYLYNEDALNDKEVYITEGIPDCLTAIQNGYSAVALLGAGGFKDEFIPKVKRCEKVYVCLDADPAGRTGAIKTAKKLGVKARIVELPEGDINEYFANHSKEDFDDLVRRSVDVYEFLIRQIPEDVDKKSLSQKLAPVLQALAKLDKPTIEAYLQGEIMPRFDLKGKDVDGYRDMIKKYQRTTRKKEKNDFHKKPWVKKRYIADFEGLVDIVEDKGKTAFLLKEGKDLILRTEVRKNEETYIPPLKGHIPWLLPNGEAVINHYNEQRDSGDCKFFDKKLYKDLFHYHESVSELPGKEYYHFLVAWVLHTYLLENMEYSPMICFFAIPERGKSRTGKGIIYVARRGIHVESLREAYIIRIAERFQVAIFFDVKDFRDKVKKCNSDDVILHRFEKGATVPRVNTDKEEYEDIIYHKVFGPTVIGTNEKIDDILETRSVPVKMPDTDKEFEMPVKPDGVALQLKERLLAFRAKHLYEKLPEMKKPAKGRLGDILKPLLQMIHLVCPEDHPNFSELVRQFKEDRELTNIDSMEANILKAVIEFWNDEDSDDGNIIQIKKITQKLNEYKLYKYDVSYQKVGRRLSAMGFQKEKTKSGASAILRDDNVLEKLKERYGLSQTSEISEYSKECVY